MLTLYSQCKDVANFKFYNLPYTTQKNLINNLTMPRQIQFLRLDFFVIVYDVIKPDRVAKTHKELFPRITPYSCSYMGVTHRMQLYKKLLL